MTTAPLKIPTLVVGLTGSLASGKSEAAEFFRKLGVPIIDADVLAREASAPGTSGLALIKEHFGHEVLSADGSLNRQALARIVFADDKKRMLLEQILHPEVRSLFLKKLATLSAQTTSQPQFVLFVVPLLFESHILYPEVSKVITISAPKPLCIARAIARNNCSPQEAEQRYQAQLPIQEKELKSDWVIHNNTDRKHLEDEVKKVFEAILECIS
ncbi:MAG: dephospho-CoA kinase [Deltaproteobacteria bacterium]|nr:dephospho-CoA kinase [Deltaproteobacteria bacterium]